MTLTPQIEVPTFSAFVSNTSSPSGIRQTTEEMYLDVHLMYTLHILLFGEKIIEKINQILPKQCRLANIYQRRQHFPKKKSEQKAHCAKSNWQKRQGE